METGIAITSKKLMSFSDVIKIESTYIKNIKRKYDTSSFNNLKKSMDIFDLPIDKRIKKSKFSKLLKKMSNSELKILMFVLCENDNLKEILKCHFSALRDPLHLIALLEEIKNRTND